MQLVYGKFDPDLNPPPFSDWSNAFSAVEIDLFQYSAWQKKLSDTFHAWLGRKNLSVVLRIGVRTQRSGDEYSDAISLWNERYLQSTLYLSVYSGRQVWEPLEAMKELKKLPLANRYFFEWGKDDTVKSTEFIKSIEAFEGWVLDPDWHSKSIASLAEQSMRFKLHGWNEERWVRRYGEPSAQRISRKLEKLSGQSLTLSYSGKVPEAPFFKKGSNG